MKQLHAVLSLLTLFLSASNLRAQSAAADTAGNGKNSYWQAEINYTSNNVYMGRKDSLRLPYFTPAIGYYHSSGLYASGGLSYLAAQGNSRIDLFFFDAGYNFSYRNFQAQLTATKYFYSSQSTNVKADVKAGIDLYAAYDAGFIQPSAEATVNFSKQADYILTLGLEHTFYVTDALDATPAVFMNAGTQHAYNSYYNQRKFAARRKKARARNITYDITADVADAASFKTLDYECSLPVNYKLHKVTFNFTPNLALPVHPATIYYTIKSSAGNQFSTTYQEELKNTFYWNAGITYTF